MLMQFVIIWQILINRATSGLAARPKLSSRPGQNHICCNPALLNSYPCALTLVLSASSHFQSTNRGGSGTTERIETL